MTEILTSASFPNGAPSCSQDDVRAARSARLKEEDVRELARAKIKAQAAWEAFCKRNASGLSEDEQIDRELEQKRLCRALNDADSALYRAMT